MIQRPQLEDRIHGVVQIENYKSQSMELDDWNLTKVMDDLLMVQYVDISEDGTEVNRNGIWLPINAVNHVWRIGKVILAGPNCKTVKEGDNVIFPNDKGIQVASINNIKHIVFLNEARIFGVCEPKPQVPAKKTKTSK